MKSIFPDEIINKTSLTIEGIKEKLIYFELQFHELHLQTTSFAEHKCLDDLYNKVFEIRDEILEKIMGYTGIRTKVVSFLPIKNYSVGLPNQIVNEFILFAKQLEEFGKNNNMPDIENIAQGLSGDGAKAKYLLTLS